MFCRDEKVVYPGYGIAIIQDIVTRDVSGKKSEFFQLKFINKEMTILVPTEKIDIVRLRKVATLGDLDVAFKIFLEPIVFIKKEEKVLTATWSKRQKDYQAKIQSGDLKEICLMYRELKNLELQKELSFGEKTILLHVEDLLCEEVAVVKNCKYAVARDSLRTFVCSHGGIKASHVPEEVVLGQNKP